VPVRVSDATGSALIDFQWDAARLASVVCSDFAIREPFEGYVQPRTYRMRGYFRIDARTVAWSRGPCCATASSSARSRRRRAGSACARSCDEQDRIFRCGLALSPERMETMLRDLLTQGFRFRLPASILRPVPLPGSVLNEVEVAGRRVTVEVLPEPPRLTRDRLWLRAAVRATALDDEPIRIDAIDGD
jgi:hypothetical protein